MLDFLMGETPGQNPWQQHLHHPSPSRHVDEFLSVQCDVESSADSAQSQLKIIIAVRGWPCF